VTAPALEAAATDALIASSGHAAVSSVDVAGVRVTPWRREALIAAIVSSARAGGTPGAGCLRTVHYANAHVLDTACDDVVVRDALNRASTVYCDGAGVRMAAYLLGTTLPPRLTAADFVDDFCAAAAAARVRVFLLGGADGVAARAADVLKTRHPDLAIAGTHHGFLDAALSEHVLATTRDTGTDVLLVGMGTPVQETWIARYRDRIDAPVVWSVGALLDFVAGVQRRAPAAVHAHGLEWAWRLGTDPRRLARRYLVGLPRFGLRVLAQRVRRGASPR
jgi:N-acetylglucosaminyldiphosphoundecaprenol N-acetyl-beta-D-mannosaminyltransferase